MKFGKSLSLTVFCSFLFYKFGIVIGLSSRIMSSEGSQSLSIRMHGGRRDGSGRPKYGTGKFFSIKADAALQDKWKALKDKGSFNSNTAFLSHLLQLEEDRENR